MAQESNETSALLSAATAKGEVLQQLFTHLADVLEKASGGVLHRESMHFSSPPSPDLGDFTFRCFGLAQQWKQDATHVAADLATTLQPTEFVVQWSATGPYLNIHLERQVLARLTLDAILDQQEAYGTEESSGDVVVLEYVSANTNKPLHIGHVRNGLIGSTMTELLRATGAEVIKTDVISDRGIHIMKSMLAYQKWGNSETPLTTGEKSDHLVGRYYVRFDQELKKEKQQWLASQKVDLDALPKREQEQVETAFRAASALMQEAQTLLKKWEAGAAAVRSLWKQMNEWTYEGWKHTYNLLGFTFDVHDYESVNYEKGRAIAEWALNDGIFEKAENGAIIIPLSKHGNLPDKVAIRGDGTSVYITQDLYLANKRFDEYGFTKCLYVVANEQTLYFQQLFATLKLLNFPASDRLVHLSYGYISLPEGRMKSREGTVVDADDLCAEMTALAKTAVQERHSNIAPDETEVRAKKIALAALKFHFLSVNHDANMVFDPKASLAFEGRTGPYLQYSYARAKSILRKYNNPVMLPESFSGLHESEWRFVLGLADFPRVIADAAHHYEPARLANYCADLAQTFSTFYHELPVLDAKEKQEKVTRLALVQAYAIVMQSGLTLLGIETMEEM